ncbi:hypothetical protein C8J56DRAFT_1054507 [Mycena floridula]|nr:hypothetical protein C8J56DRAFT_1054507 [Mycena floridula]
MPRSNKKKCKKLPVSIPRQQSWDSDSDVPGPSSYSNESKQPKKTGPSLQKAIETTVSELFPLINLGTGASIHAERCDTNFVQVALERHKARFEGNQDPAVLAVLRAIGVTETLSDEESDLTALEESSDEEEEFRHKRLKISETRGTTSNHEGLSRATKAAHRRSAHLQNPNRKAELYQALSFDAGEVRVSEPGWMGVNHLTTDIGKKLVKEFKSGEILRKLVTFKQIPYSDDGRKTYLLDNVGYKWAIIAAVKVLVDDVSARDSGIKYKPGEENVRGNHFSSNFGMDRQNKQTVDFTAFHKANQEALNTLMIKDGPIHQVTTVMTRLFENEFPQLNARYRQCAANLGIAAKDMFGPFFNFCINSSLSAEQIEKNEESKKKKKKKPKKGKKKKPVERVHCLPHVDWKNLAIGICILFIYGYFNSKARCWLVIWEAKVIVELPMGVFFMYPSAVCFHCNVDICDVEFVMTHNGELPTRENSVPLDGCGGRGSFVWFNQATMFQSGELGLESTMTAELEKLGVRTVAQAKALGVDLTCDVKEMLAQEMFPIMLESGSGNSSKHRIVSHVVATSDSLRLKHHTTRDQDHHYTTQALWDYPQVAILSALVAAVQYDVTHLVRTLADKNKNTF